LKNHGRCSGRIYGWWNDPFHREMIHRETSRVLALHLLWQPRGAQTTAQKTCALTTPSFSSRGTRLTPSPPGQRQAPLSGSPAKRISEKKL
jgi:hypothetical protein